MDNVISLHFVNLENTPATQVKNRLIQLIDYYGFSSIDRSIYPMNYPLDTLESDRHVNNLMLTYGTGLVMKQYGLLTQKVKAG